METLYTTLSPSRIHVAFAQALQHAPNPEIPVELFNLTMLDYAAHKGNHDLPPKMQRSMRYFETVMDSLKRSAQTGRTSCEEE